MSTPKPVNNFSTPAAGLAPDPSRTAVTVTVTFDFDPIYNARGGSWLIGPYYKN
jgi:hypothetical protein